MFPNDEIEDIKSTKFPATLDKIFKKGNSIDKNVVKIKELTSAGYMKAVLHIGQVKEMQLLILRKAIFLYFKLSVSRLNFSICYSKI